MAQAELHPIDKRRVVIGLTILAVMSALVLIIPNQMGLDLPMPLLLSGIILLGVYIILSVEILHRTTIALIGATAMIVLVISSGLLSAHESFDFVVEAIDFNTIGLLLGMMIIVEILSETGMFQYIGIRIAKKAKGNVWIIMLMLAVFTSTVSAFIDNVTTILLMVPVTISICRIMKVNPIPLILVQVLMSNIGGATTLIGDPPNIMIGSAAGISFNDFIINLTPTVAVAFVVGIFYLKFAYRGYLRESEQNPARSAVFELNEMEQIKDRALLKKSIAVLGGVIALFVIHDSIGLLPSVIALGGAAFLFVITRTSPDRILPKVYWTTLMFFAALFVIVAGAEKAGLISKLAETAIGITGGNLVFATFIIIWLAAFASSFVDNIPFTATMIPLIMEISTDPSFASALGKFDINPLWWALSVGANLGGNGTLIGSSAAIISVGLAEKEGHHITFMYFVKIGMPFMILTVFIASMVLVVERGILSFG